MQGSAGYSGSGLPQARFALRRPTHLPPRAQPLLPSGCCVSMLLLEPFYFICIYLYIYTLIYVSLVKDIYIIYIDEYKCCMIRASYYVAKGVIVNLPSHLCCM